LTSLRQWTDTKPITVVHHAEEVKRLSQHGREDTNQSKKSHRRGYFKPSGGKLLLLRGVDTEKKGSSRSKKSLEGGEGGEEHKKKTQATQEQVLQVFTVEPASRPKREKGVRDLTIKNTSFELRTPAREGQ